MNCLCNASRSLLCIQSSVSCNLTSNIIMIESPTLKGIEVICFAESHFEFYSQNRIEKNVDERSLVTLVSKIIQSPKERINRDWNDEEDLDKRPH